MSQFRRNMIFSSAEKIQPADEIWYTTNSSPNIYPLCPSVGNTDFGATLVSNTYNNDKGILKFNGPINKLKFVFGNDSTDGNLVTIKFPQTSSNIYSGNLPSRMFNTHRKLQSIVIPEGITTLNENVFRKAGQNPYNLVTIPSTVTSIATGTGTNGVFSHSYFNVLIKNSDPPSGTNIFNMWNGSKIYVPYSAVNTYKANANYPSDRIYPIYTPQTCIELNVTDYPSNIEWYKKSISYTVNAKCNVIYYDGTVKEETIITQRSTTISQNLTPSPVTKEITVAFLDKSTTITTIQGAYYPIESTIINYTATDNTILITPDIPNEVLNHTYGELELLGLLSSLPDNSYKNKKLLKTIIIPTTITSLGTSCFEGCTGITTIDIPSRIRTIGNLCFKNVTGQIHLNAVYSNKIFMNTATAVTYTIYLHVSDSYIPSGYNIANMLQKGDNKNKPVYNIFTDSVILKDAAIAFSDSLTTVRVKHINGDPWE